jgi:RNA polymerase sigma-70 factor (ECF subfamily)
VHGILLARLPASEVPDLVQDVFLRALGTLHTLRDPAAFVPWLSTLARRIATDQYRSGRSRFERPMEDPPAPSTPPELTAEGLAVLEALSRLPETYRETLLLRLVEGLSGREIARVTGLTEGSVRVNLSRGMRRLRAELEGGGDE